MNELLMRFFASGVLCSVALIISGGGAQREIMRMVCASAIIIMILSPLKLNSFTVSAPSDIKAELQEASVLVYNSAQTAQQIYVDTELEKQIAAKAEELGAPCSVSIISELSEGVYSVKHIELRFANAPPQEMKEQVFTFASSACGIEREHVSEIPEEA